MTFTDSAQLSAFPPTADLTALDDGDGLSHDDLLDLRVAELARVIDRAIRDGIDVMLAAWDSGIIAAGFDEAAQLGEAVTKAGIEQAASLVSDVVVDGALAAYVSTARVPVDPASWAAVVDEDAARYMRTATNRMVATSTTTWGQVRGIVENGIQSGESRETLKDRIAAQSSTISEYRGDTVARTELTRAYSNGTHAGVKALGEYGPTHKEWLAAMDARTRETHAYAHGEVVPVDDTFSNGCTLPGEGPAEETVNCRCTVLYWYPGDTSEVEGELIPGGEDTSRPDAWSMPEEERHEAGRSMMRSAPRPSNAQIIDGQTDALLADEKGLAQRAGGDRRGSSFARRERAQHMVDEYGDGVTCPCLSCGTRLAPSRSAAQQLGVDILSQDKLITGPQGGHYTLDNLIPVCRKCNAVRGDRAAGFLEDVVPSWGDPRAKVDTVFAQSRNRTRLAERFHERRAGILERQGTTLDEYLDAYPDAKPADWRPGTDWTPRGH